MILANPGFILIHEKKQLYVLHVSFINTKMFFILARSG